MPNGVRRRADHILFDIGDTRAPARVSCSDPAYKMAIKNKSGLH